MVRAITDKMESVSLDRIRFDALNTALAVQITRGLVDLVED
jgi:hypothetical protein